MRCLLIAILLLVSSSANLRGQSNYAKHEIQSFDLRYAVAGEVVSILNEQFLNGIKFSANTETNTIYGRVPKDFIPEVKDFIEDLEKTAAQHADKVRMESERALEIARMKEAEREAERQRKAELSLKFFFLKYLAAEEVLNVIDDLGFQEAGLSIAVEPRTNSLLARGSDDALRELESVLMNLDKPGEKQPDQMSSISVNLLERELELKKLTDQLGARHPKVLQLRKEIEFFGELLEDRDLTKAAEPKSPRAELDVRREYELSERNAATTAKQWREANRTEPRDQSKLEQLKSKLKEQVKHAFRLRQALKRFDIERAQSQLQTIRERLQKREELADKIIERRIEELLGDDELGWLSSTESSAQPTANQINVTAPEAENPEDGSVQIQALDGGIVLLKGKRDAVQNIVKAFEQVNKAGQNPNEKRSPSMIRGSVHSIDPLDKETVALTIGKDDGIKTGDLLGVWRDGRPVAQLEVTRVGDELSNARVVPKTKLDAVMKGDDVGVISGWSASDDLLPAKPAAKKSASESAAAKESSGVDEGSSDADEASDRTEN